MQLMNSKLITQNPSLLQTPLPLKTGSSPILMSVEGVRVFRPGDAESIFSMIDNALHPEHIRFAFNVGSGLPGAARELRCWTTEILAPQSVKHFTIDEALSAILGARETFSRGFIETQWIISAAHISNLVESRQLTETGNRFVNATLKNFLRSRWEGGRQ